MGNLEGGRARKWGDLGPFVPPSLTEGTMHYSFHVRTLWGEGGWHGGAEGKSTENLKNTKRNLQT